MSRTVRVRRALGLLVATGVALGPVLSAAVPAGAVAGGPRAVFYLAVGASDSLGIQPRHHLPGEVRTPVGYANDVVKTEAARGVPLALTQIGCPGETTFTAINGGDACYHGTATQLSLALDFLRAHHDEAGLVTVDLGFNNLLACNQNGLLDQACVTNALTRLRIDMTTILSALEAAKGPHVTIVGLSHFNPYVAQVLSGPAGQAVATASVRPLAQLNRALSDTYAAFGVPVANEVAAFTAVTGDHSRARPVHLPHQARHVCRLTYMCRTNPGPNFHPDKRGYHHIAEAIIDALGPNWPN